MPPNMMKDIAEPVIADDDRLERLGNVANKLSHIPIRNCKKSKVNSCNYVKVGRRNALKVYQKFKSEWMARVSQLN